LKVVRTRRQTSFRCANYIVWRNNGFVRYASHAKQLHRPAATNRSPLVLIILLFINRSSQSIDPPVERRIVALECPTRKNRNIRSSARAVRDAAAANYRTPTNRRRAPRSLRVFIRRCALDATRRYQPPAVGCPKGYPSACPLVYAVRSRSAGCPCA